MSTQSGSSFQGTPYRAPVIPSLYRTAILLVVCSLLTCSCERKDARHVPIEASKKDAATRREPNPISDIHWDGRSRFRFTFKEERDDGKQWLPAIYWGYTRVPPPTGAKPVRTRVPIVGDSFYGDMVLDRSNSILTYDDKGNVKTKTTFSALCFPVTPVDDPNKGGVIELLGRVELVGGGVWAVESSFPQLAQKDLFGSVDCRTLKPKFMFPVYLADLKQSGKLEFFMLKDSKGFALELREVRKPSEISDFSLLKDGKGFVIESWEAKIIEAQTQPADKK
jgi:hypothetical protein